MKRETAEKRLASHTAHAVRAAAVRLARERAGQAADPLLAYGCVDWFRYDAIPAPATAHHADAEPPPAAARTGAGCDVPRRLIDEDGNRHASCG